MIVVGILSTIIAPLYSDDDFSVNLTVEHDKYYVGQQLHYTVTFSNKSDHEITFPDMVAMYGNLEPSGVFYLTTGSGERLQRLHWRWYREGEVNGEPNTLAAGDSVSITETYVPEFREFEQRFWQEGESRLAVKLIERNKSVLQSNEVAVEVQGVPRDERPIVDLLKTRRDQFPYGPVNGLGYQGQKENLDNFSGELRKAIKRFPNSAYTNDLRVLLARSLAASSSRSELEEASERLDELFQLYFAIPISQPSARLEVLKCFNSIKGSNRFASWSDDDLQRFHSELSMNLPLGDRTPFILRDVAKYLKPQIESEMRDRKILRQKR